MKSISMPEFREQRGNYRAYLIKLSAVASIQSLKGLVAQSEVIYGKEQTLHQND